MITPETTLNEVFEFLDRGDNAVQVVPMTIKQQEDDTRLALFIHGKHDDASVIFAEIMFRMEELFDLQAQAEAAREQELSIITE